MRNVLSIIYKIIPSFYYDVPECPCCGSNKTGRYVKSAPLSESSDEWMLLDAAKNGEYVKPVRNVPDHNCFCLNCHFEWGGNVPLKIISRYKREILKKNRGLDSFENALISERRENRKNDKRAFKGIRNFFSSL